MRKVILLFSVLAVIALGWFLYFNEGDPVAFVSLYEVKAADLTNELEFTGKVEPASMYSVMSETGGTIASISVSEGSRVSKGDILFKLDDTQAQAQLAEAQLQYDALSESAAQTAMAGGGLSGMAREKAKIALALSQTTGYDYESLNNVFGGEAADKITQASSSLSESLGDISSLDSLDTQALDADSRLELARLSVDRLKKLVGNMTYTSRISGTVIAVNVNAGEVLSPGIPAMVIADTDNPVITGYVYEKDVKGLSEGMPVTISSDGSRYTGTLTHIGAAAADVGSATTFDTMTEIKIEPNKPFDKMIGAVVDLNIVLSQKKNVLSIPLDCLTDDGCVYVIGKDDKAEKRAVVLGFENESDAEVLKGLSAGDRVITSPQKIKEGQHVSYDRGQ